MNSNEKQEVINIYNDFILKKKNINTFNIFQIKELSDKILNYLSDKYGLTKNEVMKILSEIYKNINIYDYDGEKLFELIENTCSIISKKRLID